MRKLFQAFKPFIILFILAVALLSVQAYCELALPDYMSKMVNVGLQQNGIESAVPEAVRESQLNKILEMSSEQDKELIQQYYDLYTADYSGLQKAAFYSEKYPLIEVESVFVLNTNDSTVIEQLEQSLLKPMFAVFAMENQETLASLSSSMEETGTELDISNLPDQVYVQVAAMFVKAEYTALGANIEDIQNSYVFAQGLQMIAFALVILIVIVVENLLAARIGSGFSRNIREMVFKKVVSFSNNEFDKFSTASLITRSTNDAQHIQQVVPMILRFVIYSPILATGGIIKVINSDVGMTWIIALGVCVIFLAIAVSFVLAFPRFKILQKLVDKLNKVVRESLSGLLVIRAFGNQKKEEERFHEVNSELADVGFFIGKLMSTIFPIVMLTMNGVTLAIVWFGSHSVDAGTMQIGNVMAFMQYAIQIMMSFMMMSMVAMMLPRVAASFTRIKEVLNTEPSIVDPQKAKKFEKQSGEVEFKNVSFKYPGAEVSILDNISFKAISGKTTAIIGSTGSGKTTMVNLIPRFYDVTGGSVLVNGIDVRDLTQKDLRSQIGYVAQKSLLFSGTIESNIKYSNELMPDKDVARAAEIAQATAFIEEKEKKYESEISQGGSNVSGGQKQRLSIARAIAKNPKIFIFDDSFSALDFKTDKALRNAMSTELSDSTIILIAQRVGTIKNADQIIVMDEGKIVGIGRHDELMKTCDVYSQIANSQLSKEELENE